MNSLGIKISDAQLDDMIAIADLDGDGEVSYIEFVKLMTAKVGQSQAQSKPYPGRKRSQSLF